MIQFTPNTLKKVKKIISNFPKGKSKSAILNILHIAQEEFDGHLTQESMDYVASLLCINPIEVYEVASFYSMFNLTPTGKYVFEVCQTGPCMLRGSENIIEYIKEKLEIDIGETTKDGLFTLKVVECLGACGYAPMMQLGKHYKENLTFKKIDEIIKNVRNKNNVL